MAPSGNTQRDILEEIAVYKRRTVADARLLRPMFMIRRLAEEGGHGLRPFEQRIRGKIAAGETAVIAEIKKASPSQGLIRAEFNPAHFARTYERRGAACISVLTDDRFFQGSAQDLQVARQACSLPVLRKDFIVDPYQVFESRAMGADCILLIAACLDDALMRDMESIAHSLGMAVLLEVHEPNDLERALKMVSPLIGINNRNLRTFHVSVDVTLDLLNQVPPERIVVTESGVTSAAIAARLRRAGVSVFLVGEALLRFEDPGEGLTQMFGLPGPQSFPS